MIYNRGSGSMLVRTMCCTPSGTSIKILCEEMLHCESMVRAWILSYLWNFIKVLLFSVKICMPHDFKLLLYLIYAVLFMCKWSCFHCFLSNDQEVPSQHDHMGGVMQKGPYNALSWCHTDFSKKKSKKSVSYQRKNIRLRPLGTFLRIKRSPLYCFLVELIGKI